LPTKAEPDQYGPANRMRWLTDVHFTDVDGSLGDFLLEVDLVFLDADFKMWLVPKGSISDLSSFPWFVRVVTPVTTLSKAPWLHDHLYRTQPKGVCRKQADRLYQQGAIAEGMSKAAAYTLYAGLRVGGWLTWRKHRRSRSESK
jgi:hypothetical protein